MEQIITCINCPVGCRMTVRTENGVFQSVSGNNCKRGERYAQQECTMPERMVTAVIHAERSHVPLSVKTRTPIPKAKISECMEALEKLRVSAPIRIGDVVLPDVCGTGVDVIATRNLEAE